MPGSEETVDLKVLGVGKIDPDILDREEFVNPETMDNPPMPGMLVDMSPLFGGEPNNYVALTFDTRETMPAASADTLAKYNIGASDAAAYQQQFGSGDIFKMNMKFSHGGEASEILPATQAELQSVGMEAAASAAGPQIQQEQPAPAVSAPGVGLN